MITPTMEQMAIAVLRGDEAAARALADEVLDRVREGAVLLPPVRQVTAVDLGRLRAVVFLADAEEPDQESMRNLRDAVWRWLRGDAPIAIAPSLIDRIELYEVPAGLDGAATPPG